MNLDNLKNMSRAPTPKHGQTVHLTVRCVNGQFLFDLKNNYKHIGSWINSLPSFFEVIIHHLLIMSNHIHILATPKQDNLGAGMKYFVSNLSKFLNYRNGRRNHMFISPYRPTVIKDYRHLINAIRYIYQNPVRAGIVKTPFEYPYSTLPFYAGTGNPRIFVQPDEQTSNLFSCGLEGRSEWLRHISEILTEDDLQIMRGSLQKGVYKFSVKQMRLMKNTGTTLVI